MVDVAGARARSPRVEAGRLPTHFLTGRLGFSFHAGGCFLGLRARKPGPSAPCDNTTLTIFEPLLSSIFLIFRVTVTLPLISSGRSRRRRSTRLKRGEWVLYPLGAGPNARCNRHCASALSSLEHSIARMSTGARLGESDALSRGHLSPAAVPASGLHARLTSTKIVYLPSYYDARAHLTPHSGRRPSS